MNDDCVHHSLLIVPRSPFTLYPLPFTLQTLPLAFDVRPKFLDAYLGHATAVHFDHGIAVAFEHEGLAALRDRSQTGQDKSRQRFVSRAPWQYNSVVVGHLAQSDRGVHDS